MTGTESPILATLEPLEKLLLEVLALVGDGTTLTRMVKTLRHLQRRMPDGKAWTTKRLRPPLERLCSLGRIDGQYRVGPDVRWAVGRELVATGRLVAVTSAIEHGLGDDPWTLHPARLFVAVLADDFVGADAAWQTCRRFSSSSCPMRKMLRVVDGAEVEALAGPLRDLVLREVFGPPRERRDAALCAPLAEVLEAHCAGPDASDLVRARHAEQLLWAWRHEEAAALVEELDGPLATALSGWLDLLAGDAPWAVGCLKDQPGDAILTVIEIVALLALGDEGLGRARQALRRYSKAERQEDSYRRASGWQGPLEEELRRLVATVAGGQVNPHESWSRHRAQGSLAELVEALWMLAAGHELPQRLLAGLRLLEAEEERQGHAWLCAQVRCVLALANGDGAAVEELAAVHRARDQIALVDLIRPTPRWKKQLDDLAALGPVAPPAAAAVPAKTGAQRLAWSVKYTGHGWLFIRPRLQKRGKKGWTGGRAVALEHLHGDTSHLDYLSLQDRRVLKHLRCETTCGGYRNRYAETTYSFDEDAALALAGHPLLLRDGDPGRPVRLTRAQPELVVEPAAGEILVRLEPVGSNRLVFREPEPDHIEVVPLSPREQQVGEILDSGMRVPCAELDRVREVLSAAAGDLAIRSEVAGWGADAVEADSDVHLRATLLGDRLTVRATVRPLGARGPQLAPGTGERTVLGQRDGRQVQAERDLAAEQRGLAALVERCPTLQAAAVRAGVWHIDELSHRLEAAVELARLEGGVEWSGLPVAVAEAGLEQLAVTATCGDVVALSGTLEVGDHQLELAGLLDLLSASPGRVLATGDGRLLALSEALAGLLRQLAPWATRHKGSVRLSPFGIEAAAALVEAAEGDTDPAFEASASRLREADTLELRAPRTLLAELRDYQQVGFRWLARLAHWSTGACLADDMGLGKTVQALALLLHRASRGPALVVAPKSVCAGWIAETGRFAPTLDVVALWRGGRAELLASAGPGTVVVCSYGLLVSEEEAIRGVRWASVVVDEAQHIKNPGARRSRAARGLDADFRLALTGTPIENRLTDLWAIFTFTHPGLLDGLGAFKKRWVGPIERDHDAVARRALRGLVRPFLLRRAKSDVLDELPPRTDVVVRVDPSAEEAVVYEALRRAALDDLERTAGQDGWRMRSFTHLTRLRLAVCHPSLVEDLPDQIELGGTDEGGAKLAALEEIIAMLREGGHRALLFSQFVRHLQRVRRRLDALGVPYQYLDGSTSMEARSRAVAAFQAGEGDVFLISLRAGGTGLNLTAADYVVHLDPWWNPAVEDQASDRAHRLGQTRPVTVYRLVMAGTIEDRIVQLHARKRALADALLAGSDATSSLSADEILALLRHPLSDGLGAGATIASGGRPSPTP